MAVEGGHEDTMKYLVKTGGNTGVKDSTGVSTL